jgi:hypothetical protein
VRLGIPRPALDQFLKKFSLRFSFFDRAGRVFPRIEGSRDGAHGLGNPSQRGCPSVSVRQSVSLCRVSLNVSVNQ